jgi:hypothetical protein
MTILSIKSKAASSFDYYSKLQILNLLKTISAPEKKITTPMHHCPEVGYQLN